MGFFFSFFCNLTQTVSSNLDHKLSNPDLKLTLVLIFLSETGKTENRTKFVHFVLRKKKKKENVLSHTYTLTYLHTYGIQVEIKHWFFSILAA